MKHFVTFGTLQIVEATCFVRTTLFYPPMMPPKSIVQLEGSYQQ